MGDFIRTENLRHIYTSPDGTEFVALDNINLEISQGEFVAVIGTNGSGKSTLAKHFNALLSPTSGDCFVNELNTKDPESIWRIRQTVGMVFQNPDNQIVAAIVEEDVAFGPENLGVPQAEIVQRVDNALAVVGMTSFRQHGPHLLSGGQKQRVAIAGVLAMRPKCIVLDEATAMLDPLGRQEVIAAVRKINREEGITVINITHFMEEAVLADRIIVMENGRVVLTGTPVSIFTQVERLRNIGLDVPMAADLAYQLRKLGLKLPDSIIHDEELVVALCQSN